MDAEPFASMPNLAPNEDIDWRLLKHSLNMFFFFFFFSSTTLYEFWLAELFLSIVSSLAPSVSSSSLPSFSGHFSRRLP
jgi:hypothetical protein